MAIKDRIKEDIVEMTQDNKLIKELKIPENSLDDYRYVYVAYDKDKKHLIKAMWGFTINELEKWRGLTEALGEYIEKENPKKLAGYMFFLDIYDRSKFGGLDLKDIYSRKFKRNAIVDELLVDSKGFLLWDYQLENLIGLFYFDTTKPLEMRKRLNLQDDGYLQKAKEMKFAANLSLYDVLIQRTIRSNVALTRKARWYYAQNLYKTLNSYIMKGVDYGLR